MQPAPAPQPTEADRNASHNHEKRKSAVHAHQRRVLLRNFLIEAVVYAVLVVVYFLVALRWLAEPLNGLFHDRRLTYAVLGLALILAQGVVLEYITSFLLEQLRLEERE